MENEHPHRELFYSHRTEEDIMILDPHKKIIRLSVLLFILLLSLNYSAFADSWKSVGPYGGKINSLAISRTNPDVIYASTANGVFKTVDGGQSWGQAGLSGQINVVQIDPLNPDIVYAGTTSWEDALYKSEDGGVTWHPKGLPQNNIKTIAIDPLNPLIVGGCFYKSVNGGNTWEQKFCGSDAEEGILAIIIDNDNFAYIYAGLQTGPNSGINFAKSSDRGETWIFNITVGSDFINDVVALAMTPAGAEEAAIYAVVEGDDVYKSTDRGENWTSTNTPFISSDGPWALAVDPTDPAVIFAGTHKNDDEIYKSEDAGTSWSIMTNGLTNGGGPSDMVIDPQNSNVYIGLKEGGIYASTDGGASWHRQELNGGVYITDLAVDPISPNKVLVAIKEYHMAVTTNRGASWQYLINSPYDLGAVAIDPQNSSNIWVGNGVRSNGNCTYNPIDNTELCLCNLGLYVYNSKDGGQSWTSYWHQLWTGSTTQFDLGLCTSRVSDIMIKPDDSETVLIAMTNFYGALKRTTDGGDTWTYVGGPSSTIAADPNDSSYMYYGFQQWVSYASAGKVYSSSNGGANWGYLSLNETWPGVASVKDLEVNREFLGEGEDVYRPVYAATSSGLIKSAWNGSDWSWEKVSGLPTDNVTALAIDLSTIPEVIYVGTNDAGVFVSDDGGSIWTPLNEGLGNLNITKLAISETEPKTLYAGTAYGGVWSLILEEPAPDTDGDGLPDDLENATCTDANNPDTDGDGLSDGIEDANHDGVIDPTETNPCDADSDDDGILDGNEDKNHDGIIDTTAGETDPCNPDSDGDGIYDGTEIGLIAPQDPQATDQSQGYFVPDADPSTTTDPTNPDTDGDGVSDGQEDANHNGRVDAGETDPSDNSSRCRRNRSFR